MKRFPTCIAVAILLLIPAATLPLSSQEVEVPGETLSRVEAESDSFPAAPESPPTLVTTLTKELERARQFHTRLLERQAVLEAELLEEDRTGESTLARSAELSGELQVSAPGAAEIDGLYLRVVDELGGARLKLKQALDDLGKSIDAPTSDTGFDLTGIDAPSVAPLVEEIRQVRAESLVLARKIRDDVRQLRWKRVETRGQIVERMDDVRIVALEKLPPSTRRRMLGLFNADGIAQLKREVHQLRLSLRLNLARYVRLAREVPQQLSSIPSVTRASWTITKVLVIFIFYFFLRAQRKPWIDALRNGLRKNASGWKGRRRADAWVDLLRVLFPAGLFLLLIWALYRALGDLGQRPEIQLLYGISLIYGFYRLAIDVIYSISIALARRYRLSMDQTRMTKVLRSVRTLMRVIFAILVLLAFSEHFLGRGYLYYRVVQFSWVFLLFAVFLIVARWRTVIADTFLAVGHQGRMATLVTRTRDRRLGIFVSAVAFLLLAGRAVAQMGRDFAMGFDQTRRALAFLFRRRMEKQAERTGYADGDLSALPETLLTAFTEEPCDDPALSVDNFPGREKCAAMLEAWLEGDNGASLLISGENGSGKSSWLNHIDWGEVPLTKIAVANRILGVPALLKLLSRELELEVGDEPGAHELRKALLDGPRRAVFVDRTQNLFLSKVGGYDTFQSFVSLIEATCNQVFWITTMNGFACDHLFGVRPDLMVFRQHQRLAAWSEEQIGELIRIRCKAAGIEPIYDDLVAEAMDRTGRQARTLATEEAYDRLLWDYSNGNPRVAVHYWLRSLVPRSGNRFRVRLFRAPASEELDELGERARFLLAALVVHQNLTILEAAEVTRYPLATCRIQMDRMRDQDILERRRGRYSVSTHWQPAVIRALRRNNLLSV